MVLTSRYPEVLIPRVTFYQYNIDILRRHGDRPAVVDSATGKQLTYREIQTFSFKLASALTKNGLKKQDVVALCTSNCIEYPIIMLGVAACNAVATTCNPLYTFDEIVKQFKNCKPKFVFTDAAQIDKMLAVSKQITSIQRVFVLEDCKKCTSLWTLISSDNGKHFPHDTTVNNNEDLVILQYSSGTTGIPKGVMHTHYSSVAALVTRRARGMAAYDAIAYLAVPAFHSYGMNILFTCLNGTKLVIEKRFAVEKFLEAVEKYKITSFSCVPAMLLRILNSGLLNKYDLTSLKAVNTAGAPLPLSVREETIQKLKVTFNQGYGLTECLGIATNGFVTVPRGSVGFVGPNTIIKVVNPDSRNEVEANQDGEILVKGPQVMKGYLNNRKTTAATFEEGWLCTGDIGHYDVNGFLYITDRLKELIKYKGFQVAPAELESCILEHPKVSDAGVVGIPDVNAGEIPKAFVSKKDQSLTADELNAFVEGKVSKYKYLRGGIEFVEKIPRSDAGKILRRKLLEINTNKLSKL